MARSDYERILGMVNRVRKKWKMLTVFEGILYTCAVLLMWVLLGVISDNLFHLPFLLRLCFFAVLVGLAMYLLFRRVMSRVLVKITPDQAALYVESRIRNIDNRLINAVQLGGTEALGNKRIVEFIVSETLLQIENLGLEKAVDKRPVRSRLLFLATATVLLLLYWLILPAHFTNAIARLTNLRSSPPPITEISLSIMPGDAQVFTGDDLDVAAEPANGRLPEETFILCRVGGTVQRERMIFDGSRFTYTIRNIVRETRYRVTSEDFTSGWYTVTTTEPLRLERLEVTLTFPEYLRLSTPLVLEDVPEELRVVKSTSAGFRIHANRDISRAVMHLDDLQRDFGAIDGNEASLEMSILRDLTCLIGFKDMGGNVFEESVRRRIYCLIDELPSVEFLEPSGNLTSRIDGRLKLIIKARDDVALSSLTLLAGKDDGGEEETVVNDWRYNEDVNNSLDSLKSMAIESLSITLADHFKAGDAGYVYARVRDMKSGEAESGKIEINVISVEDEKRNADEERKSVLEKLREILDMQVYARKIFVTLKKGDEQQLAAVKQRQHDVYDRSLALVDFISALSSGRHDGIRTGLLELSSNEMVDVVRMLDGLSMSFTRTNHTRIHDLQKDIERELRRMLGGVSSDEEEAGRDEPDDAGEQKNDEPGSLLREMQTILRNFIAEQRRVIQSTEELAARRPEDFAEEDRELKQKLHVIEDQWARFLEEKSTELDKIPEQDFSKPTLLKELRQIYEEIDLAADELTKPGIHLPVTEEQIGLELAKKLEAKLESWLVNESDKIKWDLEEPSQDYEAPMAELPEELEDLIGDLIREEEDLDSEMEDVSSSWTDSLDAGAGWDTTDGPISNMSAKGKTGNTLPNSSEISGRSGEGRQGKSNGEFVSDTAIGKGGRRTPTRLMDDAYEQGTVNDEMTQETGGATGGGKLSGEGGEGVRGHVPPDVQLKLSKVREKYSDIINRGERIAHQLNKFGFSSEKLDETIRLMRGLDYSMANFKYTDIVGVHRQIVDGLETSRDVLEHEQKIRREENVRLPKKIRRLLNDALSSDFPEEYDELLKGYYKSISR